MTPEAIDIAREFIARWEGCELHTYLDSAGLPTIGVGHLIQNDEDFSDGITEDEALDILEQDMQEAIDAVEQNVDVFLTDEQAAALISFVFNVGYSAFHGSTLLKLLNAGEYESAAKQFPRWNKANGVEVKGLSNRRDAERRLFLGQL